MGRIKGKWKQWMTGGKRPATVKGISGEEVVESEVSGLQWWTWWGQFRADSSEEVTLPQRRFLALSQQLEALPARRTTEAAGAGSE